VEDAMAGAQSPLVVQQATSAAIEAELARIVTYLNTFPLGQSADAIGQWMTALDDFAWRLEQLTPAVSWLAKQGLPAAGQRLEIVTRDFAVARQKYLETYQNTVTVQSNIAAIWGDAQRFTVATIAHVTQYRQAVFNRWLEGYFDVTEDRCFDCHMAIGIPGGGYCWNCARRRRLI
jgi:hypothetical protein